MKQEDILKKGGKRHLMLGDEDCHFIDGLPFYILVIHCEGTRKNLHSKILFLPFSLFILPLFVEGFRIRGTEEMASSEAQCLHFVQTLPRRLRLLLLVQVNASERQAAQCLSQTHAF